MVEWEFVPRYPQTWIWHCLTTTMYQLVANSYDIWIANSFSECWSLTPSRYKRDLYKSQDLQKYPPPLEKKTLRGQPPLPQIYQFIEHAQWLWNAGCLLGGWGTGKAEVWVAEGTADGFPEWFVPWIGVLYTTTFVAGPLVKAIYYDMNIMYSMGTMQLKLSPIYLNRRFIERSYGASEEGDPWMKTFVLGNLPLACSELPFTLLAVMLAAMAKRGNAGSQSPLNPEKGKQGAEVPADLLIFPLTGTIAGNMLSEGGPQMQRGGGRKNTACSQFYFRFVSASTITFSSPYQVGLLNSALVIMWPVFFLLNILEEIWRIRRMNC